MFTLRLAAFADIRHELLTINAHIYLNQGFYIPVQCTNRRAMPLPSQYGVVLTIYYSHIFMGLQNPIDAMTIISVELYL